MAGALTVSRVADAAATLMVPLVPLMVPMTVSVAVMVRLPAWVRVTPLVKVWRAVVAADEGVVGGERRAGAAAAEVGCAG